MKFANKQEQYEWWTEVIRHIQSNKVGIRAGCRELGVPFWQYYEWKERVQTFVDSGEVKLSADEGMRRPKGSPSPSQDHSFVEVISPYQAPSQSLTLYFKDSWRLEIPENFNSSSLSEVIKALESS